MRAPFSLRPPERLKKAAQFKKVYKNGRPSQGDNFKLIFLYNNLSYNRIGISIESRRVSLSSKRIRIKRFLREIFRLNKPLFKKGYDMVFIAGAGSEKLGFAKTKDEVLGLIKKANLYI